MNVADPRLYLPGPSGSSEDEWRVLCYASALGKEFDFTLLARSTHLSEERLAEILEGAVHRGLLREYPEPGRFAFLQDALRLRVYQEMTGSRLRIVHRKIAEAMEALHPSPPPEVVAELGRHYFLGQVHEKSLRYNRKAAEFARQAFAPEEASHFLERVRIDLHALAGDHRTEEAELLRELGGVYLALSEAEKADRFFQEALALLPPSASVDRAFTLLARAEIAFRRQRHAEALAGANEAHLLLDREKNLRGHAMAHRLLSRIAYAQGNYTASAVDAEKAVVLVREAGDLREAGRCLIDLGNVYAVFRDPERRRKAAEHYEKALETLSEVQDLAEMARSYNNLGVLHLEDQRFQEALDVLERGMTLAQRAHDRRMLAWLLFNSVEGRLALGQVAEARRANAEARRVVERLEDAVGLIQVTLNDGLLFQADGRYPEAEASYRKALTLTQVHHRPTEEVEMHLRLADLYWLWGRKEESRRSLDQAEALRLAEFRPMLLPIRDRLRANLGLPPIPSPSPGPQDVPSPPDAHPDPTARETKDPPRAGE